MYVENYKGSISESLTPMNIGAKLPRLPIPSVQPNQRWRQGIASAPPASDLNIYCSLL